MPVLPWKRHRSSAWSREQEAASAVAELTRSRRAIVDAYEVERRRIERDLHDGTQQYLVAAAMAIGELELSPAVESDAAAAELVREAKKAVRLAQSSLRATVRGIHPRVLTELGLRAALADVVAAAPGRVRLVCPHPLPTMPEGVAACAYFFACEALTNAAKHAPGAEVTLLLAADAHLRVSVVDDGPGGARVLDAHGLAGMRERLAAFGGDLTVSSPPGGPTQVAASIPLLLFRGELGVGVAPHPAAAPGPGTDGPDVDRSSTPGTGPTHGPTPPDLAPPSATEPTPTRKETR